MNSDICINCVCLPICLNKNIKTLVNQCSIMIDAILDISSHFDGRGNIITVHFFDIERDIDLEIYSDTTYVFDIFKSGCTPVIGIDRKHKVSK